MKRILMLGVFASFCLFPLSANAECSSERLVELSKIADNVTLSYTYDFDRTIPDDEGHSEVLNAIFKVNISNLTKDIYIENEGNGNTHVGVGETTDPTTFNSGQSVTYTIYSNDASCKGEALTSKYITFPTYNSFSSSQECTENPEFKYCKTWLDTTNLSQEEFEKALDEYKSENQVKKAENKDKTNFFLEHKTTLIIVGAIFGIGIVSLLIIMIRRKKKQSLL